MPHAEDTSYLEPYRQALHQHGPGFEATLWASRSAQQLRFDVMIALADFRDCAVIDAGCATGDFAARLVERDIPFRKYIGLDALPQLIEQARSRNIPRCEFHTVDVVHHPETMKTYQPDFVTISGMLNTMEEDLARLVVSRAFEHASEGIVFNFLSDRHHRQWSNQNLAPARRFDTLSWLDWATALTSRVVFTQAYLDGHDATIMMLKESENVQPAVSGV